MNTTTSKKQQSTAGSSALSTAYLLIYNIVLTIGWALILVISAQTALGWKSPQSDLLTANSLYQNVEFLLLLFQTAAILEVVHASVGLVRSNPMLVFFQVLSRLAVVWIVAYPFKAPRYSLGFSILCFAWPIAEIVRYSYYALNLINFVPWIITWCRYSFFIVLYPLGVSGELICIYKVVEFLYPLKERIKYSFLMPNKYNVSFDAFYFFIAVMLVYIPVFPMLYNHMRMQRKKVLGGPSKLEKKVQ